MTANLPKVYYVMCGTGGEVEWGWMLGSSGDHISIGDPKTKKLTGYNPKSTTFFTKQQAIDDWKWRSGAETSEHADILQREGEKLVAAAENLRDKLRIKGDWRDL